MLQSVKAKFDVNPRLSPLLELSSEYLDEVVMETVGLNCCQDEADLMFRKWFDYRDLHPWLATALFAEEYMRVYGEVIHARGRIDHSYAKNITGIKQKALHEQPTATLTGIWKARQTCDALCVPYDVFVRSIVLDTESRGRAHLARPNQLYQKELLENFKVAWGNAIQTRLRYSKDPYFQNVNQTQCPIISAHQKYLVAQIQLGKNKDFRLATAVFQDKVLATTVAKQFFGLELFEKAQGLALRLGWADIR